MTQPHYRSAFRSGFFAGQCIVVTGGGSGIGRCTAHELASLGAHVVLVGRSLQKLQDTAGEIVADGGRASFHACDIRQEEAVKSMVQALVATHGRVHGLVNNAGGQYITPLEKISAKGWQAVIDTNLTGGFLVARECYLQSMQQHGGSIVNIVADIWGSMPGMGHSGAARAGMVSFTETAALEWAKSGVRVNAVAPGYIASSGMDHYPPEAGPMLREMAETVPAGRFGNEAETSAAIVYLLGAAASFVSGAVLRVDGARPQVRMGWGQVAAEPDVQQRDAVKPFDGFHRYQTPKVFQGMTVFHSSWNAHGAQALARRDAMLARLAQLRALEERAAQASAKSKPVFDKRGQLLPRERVALLLDPGTPYLPLCPLAGFMQDTKDPAASVPGGGIVAGIGFVSGVRCMVVASDSGIEAGAIQPMGLDKILRVQEIALQNKLPFVHLVESAGANLMKYRVEGFVHGGALFRNLARLSAAGIPVITVQHGSGTAGGAYMPGLSDVVIMVRNRSRAFLAGPPLLMAATGEVATEEELGGAAMHTAVSGLGEYLAEDDRHALGIAKEVLVRTKWPSIATNFVAKPPRHDAGELLTLMPASHREPVDMREVIARLVDDSDLLEFKPLYGAATVCAQASIEGHAVGFITNNGPIDVAGANKATHFIQWMCQLGQPIIYLQNTTGYMVGKDSEQGGMIKHGSKMIQAVTNATVPQITIQCGASFGAGNYGMCGRGYAPRFLFSWPGARTAVMGGEQAARTMQIVTEAGLARKGITPDPVASQVQFDKIVGVFDAQSDAFYTSGLLLDDGVIDPRDTRAVLAQCLDMCADAKTRELNPMQFGVARM